MATLTKVSISSAIVASLPIQIKRNSLRATKTLDIRVYLIVFLLTLNIYNDHFGGGSIIPMCNGGPMPTSLVLPPTSSSAIDAPTNRVVNLTRQHGGDIFTAFGKHIISIYSIIISIKSGAIFI